MPSDFIFSFLILLITICPVSPYYATNCEGGWRQKQNGCFKAIEFCRRSSSASIICAEKFQYERHVIIGDVHGCHRELLALLDKCRYNEAKDRLVFVGDLLAKGPDSIAVLDTVLSLDATSVIGNHEVKVLSYVVKISSDCGSLSSTVENSEHFKLARTLTQSKHSNLLRFLQSLPPWISLDSETLVVHAGVLPNTRPEDNSLDTLTRMLSIAVEDGVMRPVAAVGAESWAASWTGPETVVFGHDAARGLQVAPPRVRPQKKESPPCSCAQRPGRIHAHAHNARRARQAHPKAIGLDSGCVYGGRLSALVLPDRRIVSVPASRCYCPIGK